MWGRCEGAGSVDFLSVVFVYGLEASSLLYYPLRCALALCLMPLEFLGNDREYASRSCSVANHEEGTIVPADQGEASVNTVKANQLRRG